MTKLYLTFVKGYFLSLLSAILCVHSVFESKAIPGSIPVD
ncbi:hypothetical protein HG15A2_34190 [Adhaeretor mobilis]|uniref:Uncharacterized protein n=1 Tax=Adhaeretor mobilis TaxID=1930276 RepID=A0A517MZ10_9BACT|nr:hypothetical protein HG15A2_34190 [Adhaeretor mobilis]